MRQILLAIAFMLLSASLVFGQQVKDKKQMKMSAPPAAEMGYYRAADVVWKDGPASLPSGAKAAVIEGDPSKSGLFTMRLMFPAGYSVPPHFHSQIEHLTVISGKIHLGMGEKFDKAAGRELSAGDFVFMPVGMRHFAWTDGETVIQLHGQGPWTITYVTPQDDPRKMSKRCN